MTTGAGLGPIAKAVERPPDPTVGAPAFDPTDERGVETEHLPAPRTRQEGERLLRHRQTKGAESDRPPPKPPRHISTLPKKVVSHTGSLYNNMVTQITVTQ